MTERKIAAMHKAYGETKGCICKNCPNLISRSTSRTFYKCKAYGASASEATDWRVNYPACGLFGIPFSAYHVPLFEVIKHDKIKSEQPIEGQVSFFKC